MLSGFADESADETGQRIFAVAVVIGDDAAWSDAEHQWLARTGGEVFHAADCESVFAKDADKSKHQANQKLYADLTKIIAASRLIGYGVALDLAAHREYFPEVPDDVGYYKCFADVIRYTVLGLAHLEEPVEYTFDRRQRSEANATLLYGMLVNFPEWETNVLMGGKVSFDDRNNPRIQIADLVARETMKYLDNEIGPIKRPVRKSMEALLASDRFVFDKRGREYYADFSARMPELRAQAGFTEEAYAEWLGSNGLVDNWTNRFRHYTWLQNKVLNRGAGPARGRPGS